MHRTTAGKRLFGRPLGVFERLLSERGLAEAFGVNRATVGRGAAGAGGRGILETRRGSGTVVRPCRAMRAMPPGRSRIISPRSASLMPPLVAASLPAVSLSVILELERLLPPPEPRSATET